MRRALVYLLLFSFISSISELHEVFKLPELIKHYQSHCSKSPDLTFAEFLSRHYSEEEEGKVVSEHERLPFKSHDEFCHMPVMKALPAMDKEFIQQEFSATCGVLPVDETFISHFLSTIWQPPKLV